MKARGSGEVQRATVLYDCCIPQMSRFLLLLLLWTAPILRSAEWIRIASPNFELYTTAPKDGARATIETFERTRDFFLSAKSFLAPPALPVVLVAFSSAREYKPYSPRELVPAYFAGDEQRDYVVMSDVGEDRTRVAIHEYVHVLVRHSGLELPVWLNEGLADVYSGMRTREGSILVGNLPDDRAYSLGSGNWMRLAAVLNATQKSPEYNEADRSGMFYAQSCLLAHMLLLSEEYSGNFATFVDRISGSSSAQTIFGEVYGKSIAEIEKDMLAYFRQTRIGGATFKMTANKAAIESARPATDVEIGITLAKLTGMLGRFEDAKRQLAALSAANPADRAIDEAQAYLTLRSGDSSGALEKFRQLVAREGSGWKLYFDYARLLHMARAERGAKVAALHKAVELNPGFGPARLMLGSELYAQGRRADALDQLRQIETIDRRNGAEMHLLMARAAAELGDSANARRYAEEARKHARRPEDAARIEAVLREAEAAATASRSAARPELEEDERRPVIRRRPPPKRR